MLFFYLFSGLRATSDKRKLLQTWVAEGENRQSCESRVILTKESANIYRGQRELVSIRDMILVKNWPMEKIRESCREVEGSQMPMHPQYQLSPNTGATFQELKRRRNL